MLPDERRCRSADLLATFFTAREGAISEGDTKPIRDVQRHCLPGLSLDGSYLMHRFVNEIRVTTGQFGLRAQPQPGW